MSQRSTASRTWLGRACCDAGTQQLAMRTKSSGLEARGRARKLADAVADPVGLAGLGTALL